MGGGAETHSQTLCRQSVNWTPTSPSLEISGKTGSQRGWRTSGEGGPLNQLRGLQGSQTLKKICDLHRVFFIYVNDCQPDVVVVLLIVSAGISLTLSPALEILFLLLDCLAQHQYEGFYCILLGLGSLLFSKEKV